MAPSEPSDSVSQGENAALDEVLAAAGVDKSLQLGSVLQRIMQEQIQKAVEWTAERFKESGNGATTSGEQSLNNSVEILSEGGSPRTGEARRRMHTDLQKHQLGRVQVSTLRHG